MIDRMNYEPGDPDYHNHNLSGPCPLCQTMKAENLELSLQIELLTRLMSEQVRLLRDLEQAAEAATIHLDMFGFADEDNDLN